MEKDIFGDLTGSSMARAGMLMGIDAICTGIAADLGDGIRLSINRKIAIDHWHPYNYNDHEVNLFLEGKQWHQVKVEFFEIAGRARVRLLWRQPGKDNLEVISSSYLKIKRFKVVQRDVLASALKEIDIETASDVSDYFDQNTTKKFSKVQPVDALIFGEVYPGEVIGKDLPRLILRMLDIEKERLVWTKELPLAPSKDHLLDEMVDKTIEDLKKQGTFIKKAGVDKMAILNISNDTNRKLNERFLIDKLTANLVMRSDLEMVDRNNLKKLFEEYRLGKETFTDSLGREHSIINPETIKELGNVYGIKGFILGEVTSANNNSISILLKMVSSEKGEII